MVANAQTPVIINFAPIKTIIKKFMNKMLKILLVIYLLSASYSFAQQPKIDSPLTTLPDAEEQTATTDSSTIIVYKFNIKEEIGPPIWRQTQQAFKEAAELKADYILIHMNTYGGMVVHADSIRTKILKSKIPVYIFIDNNAASAGALISIACDSIYMSPGANIGAATVVNQTGEVLPDKYQSYMRSTMRSTAEAKGRDPQIAQAMVDPKIYIKGVSDSGQVLTFTTSEAIKFGFCEGKAKSVDEVLQLARIVNYKIIEYKPTFLEKIIGALVHPMISGILLMIIIGGIYFELQTPGVGFPILASITAAILYFTPLYLEGLADNWEIVLFVIGIILIGVEVFVIPGFGIAGILGILCAIIGLTLSMVGNIGFDFTFTQGNALVRALITVFVSLFLSIILSVFLGSKLLKTSMFQALVLNATQQASKGYTGVDDSENKLISKIGVALTILRPSGKVEIDGDVYDAIAEIGYIEKGEDIIVAKFETSQLFVKKYKT